MKQKAVLAATGLQRAPLARLCDGGTIDRLAVKELLEAMVACTRQVKPEALGIIGKDHLRRRLEAAGCEMASFHYKQVKNTEPGLPWVIEAAFAWCPDRSGRRLITGVNWSPGIINPFRALGPYRQSLDTVLSQQRADRDEPVVVLPSPPWSWRASRMDSIAIFDAIRSVTGAWARQRKAEEREAARLSRRRDALVRSRRMTVREAAWHVLPQAYLKASSNGTLPAHARQIMYAAPARSSALPAARSTTSSSPSSSCPTS